jgi:hypothetical protein
MVESYYASVSSGNAFYYIGLERPGPVGSNWYFLDGTYVGNGVPSNSDPYAHWWVPCPARLWLFWLMLWCSC